MTFGWITPGKKRGSFVSERHTFYGESQPCDHAHDGRLESRKAAARDYEECSTVEIRHLERWHLDRNGVQVVDSNSVERVDHGTSAIFPFRLSQRRVRFRKAALRRGPDEALLSPNGGYEVIRKQDAFDSSTLELSRVDGKMPLRSVSFSEFERFQGDARAIGWADDSSRFFVVVEFGFASDRALLSFSVTGEDDYWEGLVDDPEAWKEAFVMRRMKATRLKEPRNQ